MPPVYEAMPPDGIKRKGKAYYSVSRSMFEIDSKYIPLNPIGSGSYGVVCSAIDETNHEMVAIKKISNVFETPTDAVRALREMTILRQLKHTNVIFLKEVMVPSLKTKFKDVYLVFELMETSLDQVIGSSAVLSDRAVKWHMLQILSGISYIHSANVIHQDMKPSNILVNSKYDLKIGDFGLARTSAQNDSECMTGYVTSRWYRAPEVLLESSNYGQPIDVWSVGCIFAELLGRKPIFPGYSGKDQLRRIINILGTPQQKDLDFIQNAEAKRYIETLPFCSGVPLSTLYPTVHPLGRDLLGKMLTFDPRKRITASAALKHPYLADFYHPLFDSTSRFQLKIDLEEGITNSKIRKLIWDEITQNRPQLQPRRGRYVRRHGAK